MKQPQVRELDIIKGALAISAAALQWQQCNIEEDSAMVAALEYAVADVLKLVKRFRKEQLA